MRKLVRRAVQVILVGSLLATVASFGGAIHPLGDSLAVFRYWLALTMVASSLVLLRGRFRVAGVILATVGILAVPFSGRLWTAEQPGAGRYAIYQKNMLYANRRQPELIADILAKNADFVTLQEVFSTHMPYVRQLAERYDSALICPFAGVGAVAVLSRWPATDAPGRCGGPDGYAALQVQTPDGPVWIVSLHLHWPFPHRQARQVARLLPALQALDGPVVLAGDFNMVPWSHTLRAIEQATGSTRAGPVVRTFWHGFGLLRLPIDHVLVPSGTGQLERLPLLGSDHFGLLLRFDLGNPAPGGA